MAGDVGDAAVPFSVWFRNGIMAENYIRLYGCFAFLLNVGGHYRVFPIVRSTILLVAANQPDKSKHMGAAHPGIACPSQERAISNPTMEQCKRAFLDSVSEYNSFGVALANPRYRIDSAAAASMFGFKEGLG